ncbi:MAG: hypothetical protein HY902_19245, partial [Deltaproteobacteria bacterium]|nr:hypothetical protein [Deltaproteobacteria bacterium]
MQIALSPTAACGWSMEPRRSERELNRVLALTCALLAAGTLGCGDEGAVVGTGTAASADSFSLPDLPGGDTGKADTTGSDGSTADSQKAEVTPPNTAPKLSFVAPSEGAVVQAGAAIAAELLAEDDGGAAALTVTIGFAGATAPLWTGKPGADGKVLGTLGALPPGAVQLVATATDSLGLSTTATRTLIVNTPPGAPVVGITPEKPTVLDALTAQVLQDSQDADRKASEL